MNRFDKLFGVRGEARIRYLDGEFQVISPGDFVRCAVTGEQIDLPQLRYWSVELQEGLRLGRDLAEALSRDGAQRQIRRGFKKSELRSFDCCRPAS